MLDQEPMHSNHIMEVVGESIEAVSDVEVGSLGGVEVWR